MGKSHLDILLDQPNLVLKGTSVDVEPVRLAGTLVLYLSEDTSIRELTLQFRGKARIPMPASESLVGSPASITYVVCNHDWSFLEGDDRHSKTLKAGRHPFPFHLDVSGTFPSTIFSDLFGGASVSYKLRAAAVRPGLSHNLSQTIPINIMRTLTSEALEYQQSLEIENTWTGKLMYAIILPHKAWAGGDTLSAILKFSPLAKGVVVDSVVTNLCETTKIFARSGTQEDTRIIATAKHDIINGRAVDSRYHVQHSDSATPRDQDDQNVVTSVHLPIPPTTVHNPSSPLPSPSCTESTTPPTSLLHTSHSTLSLQAHFSSSSTPPASTPSHSLEPIKVSHHIRWIISIRNRDGHISELRCSLPVTILDTQFLDESLRHSSPSRRLLFESSGVANELSLPVSQGSTESEDRDLPSYRAHVRDRVANPPISWDPSPDTPDSGEFGHPSGSCSQTQTSASSQPESGDGTPARFRPRLGSNPHFASQLPSFPGGGPSAPLDWVNSELSRLTNDANQRDDRRSHKRGKTTSTDVSRNSSPERRPHEEVSSSSSSTHEHNHDRHHHHHHHHHHHRGFGSLFKATIKPFTSLAARSHFSTPSSPTTSRPPSRGHSHGDPHDSHHHPEHWSLNSHSSAPFIHSPLAQSLLPHSPIHSVPSMPSISTPSRTLRHAPSSDALVQRTLNEVPDYSTASRGFIGGVPPLSVLTALPTYEEAHSQAAASCSSGRHLASDSEVVSDRGGEGGDRNRGNRPSTRRPTSPRKVERQGIAV